MLSLPKNNRGVIGTSTLSLTKMFPVASISTLWGLLKPFICTFVQVKQKPNVSTNLMTGSSDPKNVFLLQHSNVQPCFWMWRLYFNCNLFEQPAFYCFPCAGISPEARSPIPAASLSEPVITSTLYRIFVLLFWLSLYNCTFNLRSHHTCESLYLWNLCWWRMPML